MRWDDWGSDFRRYTSIVAANAARISHSQNRNDFDLVTLQSDTKERPMPLYRFEFLDDERTPPISVDLADGEAAKAEALEVTRQTMIDGFSEGADPTKWVTKVYDETGYLIATITFADLVSKPEQSESDYGVIRSG